MPKFDVILTRTRTENMTIEVSGKDEDAVHDKVQEEIQKLQWDPEKIADKYKEEWEEDSDDIEIDSVEEQ